MPIVTNPDHLRALELRYVLTAYIHERGQLGVADLAALLRLDGFELDGRPSKAISDALRWERRRGRVIRIGRGRYAPGLMPRQTAARISARVRTLRERAVAPRWAE